MLEHDFEESVVCFMGRTARAFEKAINEELLPLGITFQQWQILAELALEGELYQFQLADRLQIQPPTLVGILDRMERDGWISRTAVRATGARRWSVRRRASYRCGTISAPAPGACGPGLPAGWRRQTWRGSKKS